MRPARVPLHISFNSHRYQREPDERVPRLHSHVKVILPVSKKKEATLTLTLRLLFVEKIELFGLGGNNERLLDTIWR